MTRPGQLERPLGGDLSPFAWPQMVLGMAVERVELDRVADLLRRFGDRLPERCFSSAERRCCDAERAPVGAYAGRLVAKRACVVALGRGSRQGIRLAEITLPRISGFRPIALLRGRAAERLAALTPAGHVAQVDVAVALERGSAQATVVITAWREAVPDGSLVRQLAVE